MMPREIPAIYAQIGAILGAFCLMLAWQVPESKTARTGSYDPRPSLNINAKSERDV